MPILSPKKKINFKMPSITVLFFNNIVKSSFDKVCTRSSSKTYFLPLIYDPHKSNLLCDGNFITYSS